MAQHRADILISAGRAATLKLANQREAASPGPVIPEIVLQPFHLW